MKKSKAVMLILTTLLPCYGYSDEQADNGSGWLEDNNGINKIILDETDSHGVLNTGNSLVPKNNGNNITENNVVYVTGAPAGTDTIYGGYCFFQSSCNVKNTAVVVDGGSIQNNVYGAYTFASNDSASASGSVYLNNDVKIYNIVYGAEAQLIASDDNASVAANGNVYLNDSTEVSKVYGAHTDNSSYSSSTISSSSSIGNVYLSGEAKASSFVYGAYSNVHTGSDANVTATVIGNVYLADHAKISGSIYGGYVNIYPGANSVATASVVGSVYLKDNAQASTIYGAVASGNANIGSISAQGNVSILDNATLQLNSELWGGYIQGTAKYYQVFNNNTLTMGANALTISKLGNFENYNFYLNDYNKDAMAKGTSLITITDTMQNNNTVENDGSTNGHTIVNKSNVNILGISGEGIVENGTTITLIDANGASFEGGDGKGNIGSLFNTQTGDKTTDIQVGLVGKTDATYTVDNINNKITATIGTVNVDKNLINSNVKPLAEGRLAALQNVTRGADLLMSIIGEHQAVSTYTPIFLIDGGLNKYNSGSHIDSRDHRFMIGSRYQFLDNLYAGVVVDYGRSNYDTYNHIAGKKVDGNGHTYNYGLSLFSKYTYDLPIGNTYTDAALSVGRTHTEFNSHDIVLGGGGTAHYKSKANYIGGQIGSGYIYPLNNTSSLDTSIHYLYTRLSSDSVVLDGDKVSFEKSTSSRLQLKEQYNHKVTNNMTLYVAGGYEYEFNSKAKASVSGMSVNAPSVQGSTGIMSLGVKGAPIANNKNFTFDVKLEGYTGKRDGVSLSALINYTF